jgi:hypothetical protein
MFNSSYQRVNILLTKDGIIILTDVIIVDPMYVDLLSWSCTTQKFVAFDVAQVKKRSTATNGPLINSSL